MEARYSVTTFANEEIVKQVEVCDPFIRTRVGPRGWRGRIRAAWRALCGTLEYEVRVDADQERIEQVMELDPDYLGAYDSPRRKAFNEKIQQGLERLAMEPADEELN